MYKGSSYPQGYADMQFVPSGGNTCGAGNSGVLQAGPTDRNFPGWEQENPQHPPESPPGLVPTMRVGAATAQGSPPWGRVQSPGEVSTAYESSHYLSSPESSYGLSNAETGQPVGFYNHGGSNAGHPRGEQQFPQSSAAHQKAYHGGAPGSSSYVGGNGNKPCMNQYTTSGGRGGFGSTVQQQQQQPQQGSYNINNYQSSGAGAAGGPPGGANYGNQYTSGAAGPGGGHAAQASGGIKWQHRGNGASLYNTNYSCASGTGYGNGGGRGMNNYSTTSSGSYGNGGYNNQQSGNYNHQGGMSTNNSDRNGGSNYHGAGSGHQQPRQGASSSNYYNSSNGGGGGAGYQTNRGSGYNAAAQSNYMGSCTSGSSWSSGGTGSTRALDNYRGSADGYSQMGAEDEQYAAGGPMAMAPRRGKIVTAASNGQLYKTKLCYYHVHGTCSWGDSCHHAHSLEELKKKPDLSKTSICPKLGDCKRKNCPYAHSRDELRSTDCFAKTKVCFGSCENCRFGGNCRYAHSITELKKVKDLPMKVMANIKGKKKAPPLQSLKGGDAKRGIKLVHSKAKGDFDASTYGEGYIDLFHGDCVAIVKDDEDGWMYGKNFTQDSIGWFPTSYVLDEDEYCAPVNGLLLQ